MKENHRKFLLSLVLCGLLATGLVFAGDAQASPPMPPAGLSAIAVSSSEVHLSWIDMSADEDGFVIERNGSLIATVGTNVTDYKDKCLEHGTAYSYRVSSYNADGSLGYSGYGATTFIITTVCPSGCNYSSIQAAIDVSCDGDTISVGDGTYYENIDFLGKAIAIRSVNGAESTIIDGNASGSVVTFKNAEGANLLLDGFTITNGSGSLGAYDGGGIYCSSSSPMIANCIIRGNSADWGSGIYCTSSSPTVTNCTINSNTALYGGGIYCYNSSPAISNSNINGNSAKNSSGGIHCENSSPTLINCTINDNSVSVFGAGGGIWCFNNSLPKITNCTINNNTATIGGGIHCSHSSSAEITDCKINGNSASSGGGGIYCDSSALTIKNSIISYNSAGMHGGGIYCTESSPRITNCIINNNIATGYSSGGGIFCSLALPEITNCTISSNSAWGSGGIYCLANSLPTVVNSILWGNTADVGLSEIDLDWTSSINITHSDIQGGYTGIGNINANPLLGANYHLTAGSPCINAGTDDKVTYPTLPPDDIDGDSRPQGATYDMGADEYVGGSGGIYCYDISLKTGWNLISLPQQPSNTAIESVLSSISGQYASVWALMNNSWKVYDPDNPGFSDLTQMEAGWGYWIKMNKAATLTICGTPPPKSILLLNGWNLVGYNSLTPLAIEETLVSIVGKYIFIWAFIDEAWKVYDPSSPGFSDLLTMEPGYGYWINTIEACTWTLP